MVRILVAVLRAHYVQRARGGRTAASESRRERAVSGAPNLRQAEVDAVARRTTHQDTDVALIRPGATWHVA